MKAIEAEEILYVSPPVRLCRTPLTDASAMVLRLIEAIGGRTQADLARYLGIAPPQVTAALQRGRIPERWLYRVAYETGRSVEWLRGVER